MNFAFRTLLKSTACILVIAGSFALSACTPTAGPDIAVATYGISPAPGALQAQTGVDALNSAGSETAPDQAAAVMVGTNSPSPLELTDGSQAFVPGAPPPSAVLPEALASATSVNSEAGAIANSGTYVTDGVERSIVEKPEAPAPLTPSDVAAALPTPQEPAAPAPAVAQQTATLDVEPAAAAQSIPDPIVAPKSARAAKPTLFGSLFANKPKVAPQSLTASPAESEGQIQLASLETAEPAAQTEELSSLPGVKSKNLFALDPALPSGDEPFDDEPEVQVASASAAGMARLAPNGLLKQTDRVDVSCFKPQLVSVLKSIERHYGKKVVVTSGFRSPKGNRKARGSRNSLHISCAAADIQIAGVGKWQLAKYLRSMPGRGGVGTYCHTESVHIDVGSERDWNWRCRRR